MKEGGIEMCCGLKGVYIGQHGLFSRKNKMEIILLESTKWFASWETHVTL